MDIGKLIECVREKKILYVTTLKSYKNADKREGAWREVADAVGGGVTGLFLCIVLSDTHAA